jgi:hypothetical protein
MKERLVKVNSKTKLGRKIINGVSKAFRLMGRGTWFLCKAAGRGIRAAYRSYQERKRIEEIRRQHYRGIELEAFHQSKGWANGAARAQEDERIRRQEQRDYIAFRENWEENMLGIPSERKKKKRF